MRSESVESSTIQSTTPTEEEPQGEASTEAESSGAGSEAPQKPVDPSQQDGGNGFRPLLGFVAEAGGDAAPQWPFRGVVQAFPVDEDGDGDRDLVLHFHDSTTRSTTETVISDAGYGLPDGLPDSCYSGLRYNADELWVADWYALVSLPWGGTTVTVEQSAASQRVPLTSTDYPGTTLRMAGTLFASEPTADGVRLMVDDEEAEYRVLPEPDRSSGTDSNTPYRYLRFRGTDGELLAFTLEQGDRGECSDQLTAVVSLRTGEMVACGRHAGDIQLITPPGEGLAVEQVVLPPGDVLDFEGCDLSLEQAWLEDLPAGSLFHGLQSMPVASTVYRPRCWPGQDSDPVVQGNTLPPAPFYGMVYVRQFRDDFCDRQVVEVLLHDARTRSTTLLTIFNASQLSCASHILPTVGGLEFYVYRRVERPWRIQTNHYLVELPWGGEGEVSLASVFRGRPSIEHFKSTPEMSWSDETTLGGTAISVQSHTNGVRLAAGEEVAGYVLSPAGSRKPPVQPALMGRHRLDESYVSLEGTDGELVAFSWSSSVADCIPKDVYVVSMRSGELVACGEVWSGDVLLVAPDDGGLLVDEILLPPSGWMDKQSCPHGIDSALFEALEDRPGALAPRAAARRPEPVALPTSIAPDWPFHGVVRAYQRYQSAEYRHDLVVQYYRSDTSMLAEIAFDEAHLAGLVPDFSIAELGVSVALHEATGAKVVIPWGRAPRLIAAQAASDGGWQPERETGPRHPTSLALGDGAVSITGHEPWPVGVLGLSHGNTQRWYLTSAPPEPPPAEIEIGLSERSSARTANLRGTDGKTLVFTYLHEYFDDCVSVCGLELTYLVSLTTGDVLACGVEPRYSQVAFVVPPDVGIDGSEIVLPPSGMARPRAMPAGIARGRPWLLDPRPSSRARDPLRAGVRPARNCRRHWRRVRNPGVGRSPPERLTASSHRQRAPGRGAVPAVVGGGRFKIVPDAR